MFSAKVLADSVTERGHRLTTMEWTFPRVILAEVNTHRMLSRNAASSRAIPTESLIRRIDEDPFVPEFRANQKGMQAGDALEEADAERARTIWLQAKNRAVATAREMHELNCHKQYVNRLLEPWVWCTIIVSATDWENVWKLRCNPEAEPSFQRIAGMAREAMGESHPKLVPDGGWHLPMIDDEDRRSFTLQSDTRGLHPDTRGFSTDDFMARISVGRCARVSYLTHDGKRDQHADLALAYRLQESGHWSPFEHVAKANSAADYQGNFRGWLQLRKMFANECARESA